MAERRTTRGAQAARVRRRERKNVPRGNAYIQSSFNNTIVTITDPDGNVLTWGSSGAAGFKGSRKSTPYAAGLAADNAAKKAMEHGMRQVSVFVRGPGAGREAAIRSLQAAGLDQARSALGMWDPTGFVRNKVLGQAKAQYNLGEAEFDRLMASYGRVAGR